MVKTHMEEKNCVLQVHFRMKSAMTSTTKTGEKRNGKRIFKP